MRGLGHIGPEQDRCPCLVYHSKALVLRECHQVCVLRQTPAIYSQCIPGDFQAYKPSLPFTEGHPNSSVWDAYSDEIQNYDTNMVAEQRAKLNIFLAGLFSVVVTTFIIEYSENLEPDYQQMMALLLFDQINIQHVLANGTLLDNITTSNTDPTTQFTPNSIHVMSLGMLWMSLALSILTAFLSILVYAVYFDYMWPTTK
ncbi:hypothetical protein EDD18DRAFT_1082688 [Armillaria luteobubalina]|uniref:DUF6535 domain-containing protein n=1 Tax=Armillaria luteobubalina TaxID=153913 RepID=A0AA39UP41_9AGAR|nr:hypothetical protein EDD18DRAFT_1082688 [Armillaria luteobubalina]